MSLTSQSLTTGTVPDCRMRMELTAGAVFQLARDVARHGSRRAGTKTFA